MGNKEGVCIGSLDINNCHVLHNHPESNGILSFGQEDFEVLKKYPNSKHYLVNKEYDYTLEVNKDISEIIYNKIYRKGMEAALELDDVQHLAMEYLRKEGYILYERRKIQ